MSKLEERIENLESVLGQFIIHTDVALRRLDTMDILNFQEASALTNPKTQ